MRLQKNQFSFRFQPTWLATVIYVKTNTNTPLLLRTSIVFLELCIYWLGKRTCRGGVVKLKEGFWSALRFLPTR